MGTRKALILISLPFLTHVPGLCCWGLHQKLVAKVNDGGGVRGLFPWAQPRQAPRTIWWMYTIPVLNTLAPSRWLFILSRLNRGWVRRLEKENQLES